LIIAPRHVERTDEVTALVAQQGLRAVKFSEINNQQQGRDTVVVVDTIGHLPLLYGIATIVFVGKSLTVNGGHNIIEPASAGKPVVVGPKMRNFRDVADIFLRDKAIVMVRDRHALLPCLQDLMSSPERLRELGNRAHETVEKQKGATNRTMDIIAPLIRDR